MFKLLRRVSSGLLMPRSDRPWNEDATSNAPQIGQKRRMSDELDDKSGTPSKKVKSTAPSSVADDASDVGVEDREESPAIVVAGDKEAVEVKEVTSRVGDVELEGTANPVQEAVVEGMIEVEVQVEEKTQDAEEVQQEVNKAAAVPLPEDDEATKDTNVDVRTTQENTTELHTNGDDSLAPPQTQETSETPPSPKPVEAATASPPKTTTKKPVSKRKSPSKEPAS